MSSSSDQRKYTHRHSYTEGLKSGRLRKALRANKIDYPSDVQRPICRSECIDGPRPCPFVSCRYHLYIDVNYGGGLLFNFPNVEPEEMTESCALDIADRGEHTLEEVAAIYKMRMQSIQMIIRAGQVKMWASKHLQTFANTRDLPDEDDAETDYNE